MHYDLIILSNLELTNPKFKLLNYKTSSEDLFLVNNYELNNGDTFDYLITDNPSSLKNIDVLKDGNIIICNYFLQTSLDHIFYIGKENNSSLPKNEQLDLILDFLID